MQTEITYLKGVGPERALQSGEISPKEMKNAISLTGVISIALALWLIYVAFGTDYVFYSILFIVLGIGCVAAAIKYTVGDNAYGYSGYGDLFVFLFFGLLSVCGTYFLYTKSLDITIFLPAFSIGLLSVGVLNLNNMRDRESDKKSGKNTIVVKIGNEFARYYHQCMGSPPKSALLRTLRNHPKELETFPGLNKKLITKYLPPSKATAKGHMVRVRKGLNSTKTNRQDVIDARAEVDDMDPQDQACTAFDNDMFCFVLTRDKDNKQFIAT